MTSLVLGLTVGILGLCIVLTIGQRYYRMKRFEAELLALNWTVDPCQILPVQPAGSKVRVIHICTSSKHLHVHKPHNNVVPDTYTYSSCPSVKLCLYVN